ncbi:MAG TPA: DUF4340 domain-containing protein [Candidatus Acidoferrales bacterium]|nr:DUF4340 domain-containing protein [Candidatus Acidoferrales bacterium]
MRPAIIYAIIFLALLPVYFWSLPKIQPASTLQEKEESLLKLDSIEAITVTVGAETLKFQKLASGRYDVVEPPGKFIPQDLMNAMIQLLVQAKSVEVVSETDKDLAQFELDKPKAQLTIESAGRSQPIKLEFGSENPTHTAVYARILGVPKVFLLGRNLEYYQQLMFQWIEGKQGKNA